MTRRSLLGAGASGGFVPIDPVDPGPDPEPVTVWRQITNKTGVRDADDPGSEVPLTGRMLLDVRAPASAVKVALGGHFTGAWAPTYTCTLHINGVEYPVTFNGGDPFWDMPTEYVSIISDAVDVAVEPGDVIDIRTSLDTGLRPNNGLRWAHAAGEGSRGGVALSGSWPGSTSSIYVAPLRLLGATDGTTEAWLLSGDSNTELGWGQRAIEAQGKAWTCVGLWGERTINVANRTPRTVGRFGPDASPWTHVLCAFGLNDIGNLLGVASAQDSLIRHWRWLTAHGALAWQATLLPSSYSTDGWATVENQTTKEFTPDVIALNTWIRDGSPINVGDTPAAVGASGVLRAGDNGHPLAGPHFDAADVMESARNSGLLKPFHSNDGGHPNETGVSALADAMTDWLVANNLD